MASITKILLKGGTVLRHDDLDHVTPTITDILIEGSKIVEISPGIHNNDAEVIDCSDYIVSPGFVDTHHHVYQTQFKGVHADQMLSDFLAHGTSGNFAAKHLTAEGVYWGQLAGCMEMIDAGTTTVVDYAFINPSLDYNNKALSATVSSGIRSMFCHAAMTTVSDWDSFKLDFDVLYEHAKTLKRLVDQGPYDNDRVRLGFAFDGWAWTPRQHLDMLMTTLAEFSIPLIHVHHWWRDIPGARPTAIEKLAKYGMLDHRWLIAHGNNIPVEDAELIRRSGAHISSSPSTEMHFSMGFPAIAYRKDLRVRDLCSLGVDCHSITSTFLPGEARIGLQSARAARGEPWLQKGKVVADVGYTVEEAFNLTTIMGARAAKMADQIGSIAVGKFADITLFSKSSPAMACASAQNPVAAVILHSSPADVDTVIVNGVIRKRHGTLLAVDTDQHGLQVTAKKQLHWTDVYRGLMTSMDKFKERTANIDMALEVSRAKAVLYGAHCEDIVTVD